MASNDVRDILDVSAAPKEARPTKKAKVSAQQKQQLAGLSKEVRGLMIGDSIAPIQVQEVQYKQKPKLLKKVRPWTRAPFRHPLRNDGLILRHWSYQQRDATQPGTPKSHGAPVTPADSKVEQDRETQTPPNPDTEYRFVKYSVKPSVPEYDLKQYEANLIDDDWTKEETDYLMEMAKDYELRWIVIADRYDYQPSESKTADDDSMAVVPAGKPRTMEDLKYRYYQVASKMMAINQPLSHMSVSEFELYEKMQKYDRNRETTRKKLAAALMARSPEEIREEEILMGELKRIVDNEERFLEERKELYQRLDFPQSTGSISAYETSTGLQTLALHMANNDRSKTKRRSIADNATPTTAGPQGGRQEPLSARSGPGEGRNSLTGKTKKGGAGAHAHSQRRELSEQDQRKFGVSHHERLTSGVSFRQGRVEKLVLAKSAAQAQKLHDALAELSVPVKAVMPTNEVCSRYESLIGGIHSLLDARKTAEKMNNEIRVLKAQKESRERKERGEEEPPEAEGAENQDTEIKDADDDDEENEQEQSERGRRRDDDDDDDDEDEEANGSAKADGEADADAEDDDEEGANDESWAVARTENGDEEEEGDGDGDEDAQAESGEEEREDEEDEEDEEADAEVETAAASDNEGDEDEDAEVEVDGDEGAEDGLDASEEEVDEDGEGEDEGAEAEAPKAHKRSASVLSANSQHSTKRTRR